MSTLSLEELMQLPVDTVYGASRYEQKLTQAPASVSIVTAEDIKNFGYRSLADIFRSAAGLYVTNDRNYSFLGFRGFSQPGDFNTGVLMLIDGHRVNDAIYNLIYVANEAVLDVSTIDRVEIIRGPSSSIYGSNAFFGVINILTRRGSQIDGAEASVEAGDLGTYQGTLTLGKKLTNGAELMFSAAYLESAGERRLFIPEYADPASNNGIAGDSDRERAYHLFTSMAYRDFTLSAAYSERFKQVPTAPSGTAFNTGEGQTNDARGYVDLKYERDLTNTRKLMARASYDWYPYDAVYPYANAAPPPDLILNQDRSRGQWGRAELQVTQKFAARDALVFGVDYQRDLRLQQVNYDLDPYTNYLDLDHGGASYALYTQGEFALGKKLLLNGGVRYDHFDTFGGTVNPRVGLIYSPSDTTTFKTLYGQAFRAPNDYELNYQSSTFERNPHLRPETIRSYELVYEQALTANQRFSVATYHYRIDGLIAETSDPATGSNVFRNIDQAQANGVELQLEGRYARGAQVRASYALQRTEDAATGMELSNSPRHLARLGLSMPLFQKSLSGSIELQYQGKVTTTTGARADDFVLVNSTLFFQRRATGPRFSASIYNLFDTHYGTPSSANTLQDVIVQNGRSFLVKLTKTFK